jgi:ubiquinone/menaquinone biosynthesis C-methylase UbiE
MYLMEHPDEGLRMENRDLDEAEGHLRLAGLRAGDRALDAGCASGLLTRLMASIAAPGEVVGVDLSEDRIAQARARAAELGTAGVAFERGDLYALPFPDAHFDLAFSRYTFEYLTDPAKALRELKRVTRPGGRVVVADLDGNGVFHYPIPPAIEQVLAKLTGALARVGFDPFIGRKLYHLFHQEGFRRIEVHVQPHHLIAGQASPAELENWITKFRTIRPFALKAFPSEADYDAFTAQCIELLRREDVLSYSVTFLVAGVV